MRQVAMAKFARTAALIMACLIAMPSAALTAEATAPAPAATGIAPAPTLALTEDDQKSWPQVSTALDQCVAGVTMRNDATVCRGLSTFLATFAGRVATASRNQSLPTPQSAPVPLPTPRPENAPAANGSGAD